MEEDGEQTPRTPFWIQSTTNLRRGELYRRRASSLFFNSGVLILLLLLFAILSMLYIIPTLISFSSQIFKPNLVKKSWDSINLVLVLFALAFGFLGRNINNGDNKPRFENGFDRSLSDLSTGAPVVTTPPAVIQNQWYDFPEQPIGGLRSTSSYPDLRELTPQWNHRAGGAGRFSDDTHLNSHRVFESDRYYFRHRREQDPEVKDVIHVDSVVDLPKVDSYTPPPPPPPPPPQPPATGRKKPSRIHQNVGTYDGERSTRSEFNEAFVPETESTALATARSLPSFQDSGERNGQSGIRKRGKGERRRARSSEPRKMVSPERSSPPPISPVIEDSDQKTGKVERKRTGANATKEFFTSFYQKKKKKRQRQRSVDNLDTFLHHPPPPVKFQLPPPSPPPPPPPLPPPPSILNNLFTSKKERRKKLSSTTTTLPPPPPPPPPPRTAARGPKPTITRVAPFVTEKPRVPLNLRYLNSIDDSSSGGESPMSRIPPPPPMPPFKMPDWKFAVEGNYVRVQSTLSSGSLSPDGDEAQSPSSAVATPLFCPSPDVDTKADTFIARFRAGLKLEKINSFNQIHGLRMSNLGPGPGPSNNNGL